ncbi:unnamed protein product [Lepeophtheirus salmonis]|uniref:(salmon louse) hypothetical protein n=3 Tax=Lepeophtheirus salmonis TaxID=72036 RepID=A0A7R8H5E1_LEPSM|nr:unnamed protein product [Lepeophtheirus salmonis]CAF2874821.1 unnamed protein product [Lepeophtheirus salmonis]
MKVLYTLVFMSISVSAQYYSPLTTNPSIIDEPALYKFTYNVNDFELQNFGHEESRDGAETHGEYRVALPDGRTKIVTYEVIGDSGFVAGVKYEGEILPFTPPQPAPYEPSPPPPAVYQPLPNPLPPPAPKPAPLYYKPIPPPIQAPVYYKPLPPPTPTPKSNPPRKTYGPVRFNPFG